jgi:hypothetical protein
VERAKQVRSIYWHVPVKASATRPRVDSNTDVNPDTTGETTQIRNTSSLPITQTEMATQRVQEPTETLTVQLESKTNLPPTMEDIDTTTALSTIVQRSVGEIPPLREEWATLAMQQEPEQSQSNPPIDPQVTQETTVNEEPAEVYPPLPIGPPMNAPGSTVEAQNADEWLDNIFNGGEDEWLPDTPPAEPSLLTSEATPPDTAGARIFRGCRCPEHQHIYDSWPLRDADLTIAKCITVCVYCGTDYHRPPTLRQHLKAAKHAQHNISVVRETMGRGSSTIPSWKPKKRIEAASNSRVTRSSPPAGTNSTNAMPELW